jgi:hypothetical protein
VGIGLVGRLLLGWGKVRRAYLHLLHRDYIRRNHARRGGECARCGACCKLMFRCPYLDGDGMDTECVRHGNRWENCRIFPIDEHDIADRDLVSGNGSGNGKCGYSFDPPRKPPRWFALAAAALVGISSGAGAVHAAEASRAERVKPLVLNASFASGRAPEGWRIESGTWEPARKGLRSTSGDARLAATLRDDMMPVAGMDFRVEVWVTFESDRRESVNGTMHAFGAVALRVTWGELDAGVLAAGETGRTTAAFPGESSDQVIALSPGRQRVEVALERGVVSVRVGRGRAFVIRDVFDRLAENAPRDVTIWAAPNVVIHAARVSATPARARPEALGRGDAAWRAGDRSRAAVSYMETLGDGSLPAAVRAEAACKLGWHFDETESYIDAARSFDRAQRLDPEGPWAERARVALGRAALAVGDAETALAFARAAAQGAGRDIEDWPAFRGLVTSARKRLAATGSGARATFALRRIAEHLEWAPSAPARTQWAWEEVALSLDGRGWEAEAAAVRKRAMSVLGRRVGVAATPAELESVAPQPAKAPSPPPPSPFDDASE